MFLEALVALIILIGFGLVYMVLKNIGEIDGTSNN